MALTDGVVKVFINGEERVGGFTANKKWLEYNTKPPSKSLFKAIVGGLAPSKFEKIDLEKELVEIKLIDSENRQSTSLIGKATGAVVGNALFGTTGAIVGAVGCGNNSETFVNFVGRLKNGITFSVTDTPFVFHKLLEYAIKNGGGII